MKYDIFLICPVRKATEKQKLDMRNYIYKLKSSGKKVYYPATNTDQNDKIGFRICSDNREAIMESEEIHIYWDKDSQGSLFDLGMAFALGKKLVLVNNNDVEITPTKSFSNMIKKWSRGN